MKLGLGLANIFNIIYINFQLDILTNFLEIGKNMCLTA